MKSRLIILLFAIINFSCNNEIECDLPPPNSFTIDLQDENEISLINNVYPQDAIRLYNERDTIALYWQNIVQMKIPFESINSNENYYLELSSLDTDTLWVQWSSTGKGTCRNYLLDSMRYNNTIINDLIGKDIVIIKN